MKKLKIVTTLFCLVLPAVVNAIEFQPLGAVGIGGAGVARMTDAFASYWNPAGLAFYEKPFSARLNGGVGININSSLADNVDKMGKMDITDLQNLTFGTATTTADAARVTGQAVEFVGIINNLDQNQGNLTVTPGGVLAFQYRNFGLAGVVTSEMGAFASTDPTNVRPGDPNAASVVTFGQGIGALAPVTGVPVANTQGTLFSTSQRNDIVTAFTASNPTLNASQAAAIVNTLEAQLQAQGGNKSGQSPQQLADALVRMAQSFGSGATSIENNKTSIELRGILLAEIPLAYGHKFDLGKLGQIGVGGALKIMRGTTYASSEQIVKLNNSEDIVKKVTDRQTDSINVGLDLGAMWRYTELPVVGPLNVGIVLKNLNSPEFDMPQFTSVQGTPFNQKVKVDPQARMGAALDLFSWLSLAADLDLTSNSTLLPGRRSQNIGGGVDLHPLSWFALRAGMFGNVADSTTGPVGTVGLSFGPKWLRFDIDGAAAFETGKYKNSSYPREAKVEFGLSTMF